MTSEMTTYNRSFSQCYADIRRNEKFDFDQGIVYTVYGIVSVYSQGNDDNREYTKLMTIKEGRIYVRTWNKRYSKQYLVTLAKRFAEVVFS